jgi:hypothetical protein
VGSEGTDGEAVEGGFAELGILEWAQPGGGNLGFWRRRGGCHGLRTRIGSRGLGVLFALRLRRETEQFGPASLYVGEGGQVWARYARAFVS